MSATESLHYKIRRSKEESEEILTQPEFDGLWDKKQKPYKVIKTQNHICVNAFCLFASYEL